MKNCDSPASPIKLNERIECGSTGSVTINECDDYFSGLTKREAFAMAAMQGILSHSFGRGDADELAVQSIKCADALLKQLEEVNNGN